MVVQLRCTLSHAWQKWSSTGRLYNQPRYPRIGGPHIEPSLAPNWGALAASLLTTTSLALRTDYQPKVVSGAPDRQSSALRTMRDAL
jgi:hypothetical protein